MSSPTVHRQRAIALNERLIACLLFPREFANDGRQEGVVAREFQKWVILYK